MLSARPSTDELNRLRAKIHVARKQLGMDDAGYRAALLRGGGITTTAGATISQLTAALDELRRLGFQDRPGRKPARTPQLRMLHAVWRDLVAEGAVSAEDTDAALRAFVARQTRTPANPHGVSAPEFLDSVQANRVLEGLKAWRARHRATTEAAA